MIRLALPLIAIGTACGVLLVGADALTRERIGENRAAADRALLAEMLAAPIPASVDLYQQAFTDCATFALARTSVVGYAGTIELVLVRRADETAALRVTRHLETPGIGDFIDHRRDAWITRYDGQPSDGFAVDGVSGATVTTDALQRGVEISLATLSDLASSCG